MSKPNLAENKEWLCDASADVPQGEQCYFLSGSAGVITAQAADDITPPERLVVVPWGETVTPEGTILLDAEAAELLRANMSAARRDTVAGDFDHANAFGRGMGQPRTYAFHAEWAVEEGVGIVLSAIRWTPAGKASWANYQDLSPALRTNKAGRITFLDSVALTPYGKIPGLTLFSAETQSAPQPTPTPRNKPMNLDALRKSLTDAGISTEGKDDESLIALAAENLAKLMKPAANDNIAALTAEVAAITSRARRAEIAAASKEGKSLPPEDVLLKMSAEDFSATLSAAKPGAVNQQRPAGADGKTAKTGDAEIAFSAEELKVFTAMGVTPEKVKEFGAEALKV